MLGFLRKNKAQEKQGEAEQPVAGLHSGTLVEVLTTGNHLIFVGVLENLGNGMIQIRDETGSSVPQVEYNTRVKLRAFQRNQWVMALYGQVCGSTTEFWRLDRLAALRTEEKRDFFRQNVQVDAQVWSARGAEVRSCRVLDISAGGVLVRCQERYVIGQILRLSNVRLLPGENAFSFTCRVQRATPNGSYTNYGCRFEKLSTQDEDRLMRVILSLQRKTLQARRGNGNLH